MNDQPRFLSKHSNNVNDYFDFSHKFLIEFPIYFTAKLSLALLVYLMNSESLVENYFDRLLEYIYPYDTVVKSAPESNQQPIINCFVLTAKTSEDYDFFKNERY